MEYATTGSENCGHILISRKFRQRLDDVSQEDIREEGYNSLEEFKKSWIEINGFWALTRLLSFENL